MPSALYNDNVAFAVAAIGAFVVIVLLLIWNLFLTGAVNDLRTKQASKKELLIVYGYVDRLCDLISKLAEIHVETATRVEALEATTNKESTT